MRWRVRSSNEWHVDSGQFLKGISMSTCFFTRARVLLVYYSDWALSFYVILFIWSFTLFRFLGLLSWKLMCSYQGPSSGDVCDAAMEKCTRIVTFVLWMLPQGFTLVRDVQCW
jgi:hypothetical protein